jgi:hypothetical protein
MTDTDDLGLGELSDDQVVELAAAVADEIARRDGAVFDAARQATAGARARRKAAAVAADRIWATQWSDWACARRAAMMIDETLGRDWRFTVWRNDTTGERRVYLDGPEARSRASSSDAVRARHGRPPRVPPVMTPKVSFFVDGSSRYPPGHLVMEGGVPAAATARLQAIARFLAARWDVRGSVSVAIALAAADVEPAPPPPWYQ